VKAVCSARNSDQGGSIFLPKRVMCSSGSKCLKEDVIYTPELIVYHPVYDTIPELKVYRYSYATGVMLTSIVLMTGLTCMHIFFLISRLIPICSIRIIQQPCFPD